MQSLLKAIRDNRMQSVATGAGVRFSNSRPAPLLCHACGKKAEHKCGSCSAALYCSEACQRAHWVHHKKPCSVDRQDTSEAQAEYYIDHKCRHGGPDPSGALLASLQQGIGVLGSGCFFPSPGGGAGNHGEGLKELLGFLQFARATPPHPLLHRVLISCAVDAFADNNFLEARALTRLSLYCHAVSKQKGPMLQALEAGLQAGGLGPEEGPQADALRALAGSVKEVTSRSGLLRALKAPMTCSCLAPFASALPCATLGEEPTPASGSGAAQEGGTAPAASASGSAPAAASASGGSGGGGDGGAGGGAAGGEGAAQEPPLNVEEMSVKELKAALAARGVSSAGLVEKQDLHKALRSAIAEKK